MTSSKFRWALVLILSAIITLLAAFYQRSTGPTYPKKYNIELNGQNYKFSLKRSHTLTRDCFIELKDAPDGLSGTVFYRPYPTNSEWQQAGFLKEKNTLTAALPVQPAAGKLQYYLELNHNGKTIQIAKSEPVIMRFKGDVPAGFMIPHILVMFLAMFFSNLTGLLVITRNNKYRRYMNISFVLLLVGGLILGPIIQKYAFGHFWTGFPFGYDLTDNKTLIIFLVYAAAVIANLKKPRPYWALIAAIVLLLIYSIPHSLMGSELDYSTGQVVTGA